MKLLTAEILKKLPRLYAQDGKGMDALVYLKLFNPCGAQTFYITEGEQDGNDFRMFGYAAGVPCPELGYFSLNEILSVKVGFGLHFERDRHFPCGKLTLNECIDKGR